MDENNVGADETLLNVLRDTNLDHLVTKLCSELQLTRLEHFDHITDEELQSLAGLSIPAIRRLRSTIDEAKKSRKFNFKTLFGVGVKGKERSSLHNYSASSNKSNLNTSTTSNENGSAEYSTCLIAKEDIFLQVSATKQE